MNTALKLKLAFLVSIILFSLVTVVPSFYQDTPNWWKTYMAPEGLRLGLDLQGGMHLVLKVNLQKAEENSLELAANDLKDTLSEESISAVRSPSSSGGHDYLHFAQHQRCRQGENAHQRGFSGY